MFRTYRNAVLATLLAILPLSTFATNEISYSEAMKQMDAKSEAADKPSILTESDKLTMKAFKAHLAKTMPNPGIAVGQQAPNFSLQNAFGKTVSLKDELKKGPVVLVFYRGSWCPYCNLHLHVLNKAQPQFDQYNAQLIAVTPQQPNRSAEQIKKDGYPFEVLSDSDSQVMKDYRLYFELSEDLLKVYSKFKLDLEGYNGKGRNVLPVPGSFVIDQSGKVVAMQAQTDYKARMEPADIIKALKAL